jgi:hypothetical protein
LKFYKLQKVRESFQEVAESFQNVKTGFSNYLQLPATFWKL